MDKIHQLSSFVNCMNSGTAYSAENQLYQLVEDVFTQPQQPLLHQQFPSLSLIAKKISTHPSCAIATQHFYNNLLNLRQTPFLIEQSKRNFEELMQRFGASEEHILTAWESLQFIEPSQTSLEKLISKTQGLYTRLQRQQYLPIQKLKTKKILLFGKILNQPECDLSTQKLRIILRSMLLHSEIFLEKAEYFIKKIPIQLWIPILNAADFLHPKQTLGQIHERILPDTELLILLHPEMEKEAYECFVTNFCLLQNPKDKEALFEIALTKKEAFQNILALYIKKGFFLINHAFFILNQIPTELWSDLLSKTISLTNKETITGSDVFIVFRTNHLAEKTQNNELKQILKIQIQKIIRLAPNQKFKTIFTLFLVFSALKKKIPQENHIELFSDLICLLERLYPAKKQKKQDVDNLLSLVAHLQPGTNPASLLYIIKNFPSHPNTPGLTQILCTILSQCTTGEEGANHLSTLTQLVDFEEEKKVQTFIRVVSSQEENFAKQIKTFISLSTSEESPLVHTLIESLQKTNPIKTPPNSLDRQDQEIAELVKGAS